LSITKTEDIFAGKILSLQKSTFKSESLKNKEVLRIACPNWVNIIPVTINKEIIFVRQFRYGANENTLEIPGGMVDEGEDPMIAATRELAEETGYTSTQIIEIGRVEPNPALMSNYTYSYLALNASQSTEQKLDGTEDIEILKRHIDEIPLMIEKGEIQHALVICAFYFYNQYLAKEH